MSTILALAILAMLAASLTRGTGCAGRVLGVVIFIALVSRVCQTLVPPALLAMLPLLVVAAGIWTIFFGMGQREAR